mgnify:CR=1 FL=1
MNLPDEELEKELAAFQPVQPNETLKQKIAIGLDQPEINKTRSILKIWPIIALATAACVLLAFKLSSPQSTIEAPKVASTEPSEPSPESANFQSFKAEQHLLEALDEGVVLTANNEPVRKLRYQFVDTVTMINEIDGSIFTMEIPREEILFVPLTLL